MSYQYDVCFSFAGEDRKYVSLVAHYARNLGLTVFYDNYNRTELWGKDLYTHLDEIYRKKSNYCVMFISENYAKKLWTNHERKSAQARAFIENSEYILPARFDNTEIPGIPPTTGYVDLKDLEPRELAEMICEKVTGSNDYIEEDISLKPNQPYLYFTDNLTIPALKWPSNDLMAINSSFQLLPVNYHSKHISTLIEFTLDSIKSLFNTDGNYWTYGKDRVFDRIYATTSVLTYLFQLGLSPEEPIVKKALDYLDTFPELTIENRANIFLNIWLNRIEESRIVAFLKEIRKCQCSDKYSSLFGSFLFPQGDTTKSNKNTDNWQSQRYHKEGGSFHACYTADILLHIKPNYSDARNEANQILDDIRQYFNNSFHLHHGFLTNLQGEPSTITLFGYALTYPLHIGLPRNWLDCVDYCVNALNKEDNLMSRCLGVMNLYYFCRMNNNTELQQLAYEHVYKELGYLWTQRDFFSSNARDLSIFGRCFAYGYRLLNYDAGAYILDAVNNYDWER